MCQHSCLKMQQENKTMNDETHVLLSEKLEDQLKAVEWAHEQKKILDDKSRRIADALMEK